MLAERDKTKEQLINELEDMRQRVVELEASEAERKQAEEALRESEGKYRTLVEEALVGIVNVDIKGKITYVNETVLQGTGYSREEMVGKNAFRIGQIPLETVGVLRRRMKDKLMGKPPGLMRMQFKCKDGKWIWLQIKGKALWEHGMPVGVQIIGEDITERKQAEEALRESEEKLRRMFESANDGITVTDLNGVITDVNERVVELGRFGSRSDVIGKSAIESIVPRDQERALRDMQELAQRGVVGTEEYTLLRTDGSEYPAEISANVLKDATGNVIGFVSVIRDITERKQAEEELRKSEEKYRELYENAPVMLHTLNKKGVLLDCNKAFQKTIGYRKEEMIGKPVYDFETEESRKLAPQALEKVAREGTIHGERDFITKDGKLVTLEFSARIECDEEQNEIIIKSALKDITERKKIEEELRESEERYRALVSLEGKVGEAIVMLQDTEQGDAIQTFVSDQWPRITGYSRKELLGMSFFDLVHPKDRQASRERHKRKMSGESIPGLFEMSIIRKDGTEVPIELTSAYTTYQGRTANVAFVRDITERKQAEEEVARLAKFPSENPNPVLRIDQNGAVLYANRASLPLLGVWGCQVGQLLPGYLCQLILDVLGSGVQKYIVVEYGEQTFSFILAPVVEAGYVNLYGRDITERKQAEEREKWLQQELTLSSRLAAIGELAAGVAHEINNPLTGIIGFSERLLRKSTEEGARQHLAIIHDEAQRAAKVVENLLTFARHRESEKEQTDINEILGRTLELRAYELRTSNIELVVEFTPGIPRVIVDFQQIQQVFLNIILNAEQAMTEVIRGGKLSIKTEKAENCIRISFTDDGPGIPAEHLDKLFDPFFTTRGERGGTGLGLSVCHGIVTAHGGRIYAESKPGKVTTFVVELPVTTER